MARHSERGLLDVAVFIIPQAILNETIQILRRIGAAGKEGFVLWGGNQTDRETFRFTSVVLPAQRAVSTRRGLLVHVAGDALFEINKVLFERGETLAGQVHTHPTSAYHSSLDDRYPLVTLLGSISVVVPHFARDAPGDMPDWAWYRMVRYGMWEEMDLNAVVLE